MARLNTFSEAEIAYIHENYPTQSWDKLLEGINKISSAPRNKQAIIGKASQLGVRRNLSPYSNFSEEEDFIITELYRTSKEHELTKNIEDIIKTKMPYRTVKSVQTHASHLGLRLRKSWTEEDIDFLVNNYYEMTTAELARNLGRTENATYIMTKKLGLTGAPMTAYSKSDIQFIADNYSEMSDEEIGSILHRKGQSIKECRRKHGLYRRDPEQVTRYQGLIKYVQAHNSDWRKRSMESCGYKCVLTNGTFDDIHHLYAKNLILNTVLEKLSIPQDIDINICDDKLKRILVEEFQKEQNKYPLGVCLKSEHHHKFHAIYGFGYNTPEQFYEFAKRFPQNRLCINNI